MGLDVKVYNHYNVVHNENFRDLQEFQNTYGLKNIHAENMILVEASKEFIDAIGQGFEVINDSNKVKYYYKSSLTYIHLYKCNQLNMRGYSSQYTIKSYRNNFCSVLNNNVSLRLAIIHLAYLIIYKGCYVTNLDKIKNWKGFL